MALVENRIENGIVIGIFTKGNIVDLPTAVKMVNERLEFQNGVDYPIMICLNGLKFASSEARNYMQKEGLKGLKAGAFIVTNPVEKVIMNFLLYVSPPSIPARMFTNEKDALEWLEQYK